MSVVLENNYGFEAFPTPEWLVVKSLDMFCTRTKYSPKNILDPGAGTGIWGEVARRYWPDAKITGIDLQHLPKHEAYDEWLQGDYLNYFQRGYDLIMGNPPFSYAEEFVRHSIKLLDDQGYLMYVLRLAFLESQGRGNGLWVEYPHRIVAVCKKRPSFTNNGNTDTKTAYATYLWDVANIGKQDPVQTWI